MTKIDDFAIKMDQISNVKDINSILDNCKLQKSAASVKS